jgi:hypothetical protein
MAAVREDERPDPRTGDRAVVVDHLCQQAPLLAFGFAGLERFCPTIDDPVSGLSAHRCTGWS